MTADDQGQPDTAPQETAQKPAPQADQKALRAEIDRIVGQAAELLSINPKYRQLFLADLEWLVYTPLRLKQARVLTSPNGIPVAFASWAFVNEAVEKRLEAGQTTLRPNEWRSGDRAWIIDVATTPQALPAVLTHLQQTVFAGRRVRTTFPVPKQVKDDAKAAQEKAKAEAAEATPSSEAAD